MNFFGKAREAAAAEYGRTRAEAYGRRQRIYRFFEWVAIGLMIIGILMVWNGR